MNFWKYYTVGMPGLNLTQIPGRISGESSRSFFLGRPAEISGLFAARITGGILPRIPDESPIRILGEISRIKIQVHWDEYLS